MTNNIVVYFASSLNVDGTFKEYRVISGSVFNEEYSETLDSATICLSQVKKEDRLNNIKPYDYVRVFDKSGNTGFDKLYLVDNFSEKENNINEHIFSYTINLMSETKLLEKIQCPNVAVTHKVNEDGTTTKKTIYQLIKQYMDLFVPKIKYSSDGTAWSYQPLISYPTDPDSRFYKKFNNHTAADLPLTAPTMRQLLTSLMQQVGCIPTVHNRVLGFLDFQDDVEQFGNGDYTVENTVNSIGRSLSSDSFVNNLINVSNSVLDSENEVISETLCFRDKNNVLLKQTQNLYLETSFPIYKINKCLFRSPGKYSGYISSSYGCYYVGTAGGPYPCLYYNQNSVSNNEATVTFSCNFVNSSYYNVSITNNKIYFLGRNSSGNYYIVSSAQFDDFVLNSSNTTQHTETYDGMQVTTQNRSFTFSALSSSVVGFFVSGRFSGENGKKDFAFVKYDINDTNVYYWNVRAADNQPFGHDAATSESAAVAGYKLLFSGLKTWDITKLVVENSARQLLERDFTKMNTQLTVNKLNDYTVDKVACLSKYVYGTVGYNIGSKQISGFSEVYNVGSATMLGWITQNYTYIENILNILSRDFTYEEDLLLQKFEFLRYIPITFGYHNQTVDFPSILSRGTLIDYQFSYYNPTNNAFSGHPFFTSCFVDLYYQPLNSFNLAYSKSKEDIDIPLQQYDGNSSGLTDFDRLSIHEQEQVDRIGNETLFINQRTTNFNQIQKFDNGPLIFMDDTNRNGIINSDDKGIEYVIFKYSYTIKNNCFNVSYIGAKDSVLKNYFTSIRTKYRAYQYVDYSQSTLRKERDTFYIRVSTDWYRGDDRIWLGNYQNAGGNQFADLGCFMYDLSNETTKPISYECENDTALIYDGLSGTTTENQTTKNSVSLITTNNMLGIIYENNDNVGAGTYIANIAQDDNLGGIPQSWQIWDKNYSVRHLVSYVSYIDFYSLAVNEVANENDTKDYIAKWQRSPIVDDDFIDLSSSDYNVFSVCDDNSVVPDNDIPDGLKRTFYKDDAECINHTVQFIYYAPNNDVLFGEDFISGTPTVGRFIHPFYRVYGSSNFELDVNEHSVPESDTLLANRQITSQFSLDKNDISQGPTSQGFNKYYVQLTYNIPTELPEILDGFTLALKDTYFTGVTLVSGETPSVTYDENSKQIVISMYITDYDVTNLHINVPYYYLDDSSFCDDYIEFLTDSYPLTIDRYMVKWNGYDVIKLCSYDYDTQKIRDIVAFKKPKNDTIFTTFFFTINDTKTDYVLSSQNGILYRRYMVKTAKYDTLVNTVLERQCNSLYIDGNWSGWTRLLTINTVGMDVTVSRVSSSNPSASLGTLTSGDYVYPGDVLEFLDIETAPYYLNYSISVDGEVVGSSHTYTIGLSHEDVLIEARGTNPISSLSAPNISYEYYQYTDTHEVWCEVSCSEQHIYPDDVLWLSYAVGSSATDSTVIANNTSINVSLGTFDSTGSVSIHNAYLGFDLPQSGGQTIVSPEVSRGYSIAAPLSMNDPVITEVYIRDHMLYVGVSNTNNFAVKCNLQSSMTETSDPNYYFNIDANSQTACAFALPSGSTATLPSGTLAVRFKREETNRISIGPQRIHIVSKELNLTMSNVNGSVRRTSSPTGASLGDLSNGDSLYVGDVLSFSTIAPSTYCENLVLTVNGTAFSTSDTFTVPDSGYEVRVIASATLITGLSNPPQFSTKYTHDYSTNEVTVTVSCNEPELNDNDTVTFRYFLNGTSTYGGAITNHSSATISLGTYSSATTINITDAYFRFEFPSSYGAGRFVESDYVDKTYNITRNVLNPVIGSISVTNATTDPFGGSTPGHIRTTITNNNSFGVSCEYSNSEGTGAGLVLIASHSSVNIDMEHNNTDITHDGCFVFAKFTADSSASIQITERVSKQWPS